MTPVARSMPDNHQAGSWRGMLVACAIAMLPQIALSQSDTPLPAGDWPSAGGNLAGWRHADLSGINRDNLDALVPLYSVQLGGILQGSGNYRHALPTAPLIHDGQIYIIDGQGILSRIDATARGAIVWRTKVAAQTLDGWFETARGLALHGAHVIAHDSDGQIHWIDRENGEITRSARVGDPADGYLLIAPPLVVGDMILLGGAGTGRGARGQIDAISALTGEVLWTLPLSDGTGLNAGSIRAQATLDPATGLTLWTIGARPRGPVGAGDGHDNTTIAVDPATGDIIWSHRWISPENPADLSLSSSPLPLGNGQAVQFATTGFVNLFDSATGAVTASQPTVPMPRGDGADDPWRDLPGCPNILTHPDFLPAYSPQSGLVYGSGADGCLTDPPPPIFTDSAPGWLGAYYAGAAARMGWLSAFDPATGKITAARRFDFPLQGGMLSANGLVFATTAEGRLHALDDKTLETLWSMRFGAISAVPPFTFTAEGRQYLGVVVGGNALAAGLPYLSPEGSISAPLHVMIILGVRGA